MVARDSFILEDIEVCRIWFELKVKVCERIRKVQGDLLGGLNG